MKLRGKRLTRTFFFVFLLFLFIVLIAEIFGYRLNRKTISVWEKTYASQPSSRKTLSEYQKRIRILEKKLTKLAPVGTYIVIDTAHNILYLKKGEAVLCKAAVSCGSGNILEEPGGRRKWVFDTPRGVFTVNSKIEDPSWVKPDWGFIEEEKAIPKAQKDRIEAGVLGEYALGFGKGYFIHGTLYSRLLGRNVTHGCVRVGDKDLRTIFHAARVGTRIFIF